MKIIFTLLFFIAGCSNLTAQCTGPANDCDGDGILNNADIDNDNDGIVDTVENGQGTIQWTAAQIPNILTTPFTATVGCGTNINFSATNNGGFSAFASSTTNYNTLISTDMGVAMTMPRSMSYTSSVPTAYGLQGSITLTLTPGTLFQLNLYFGDPENTSYIVYAYDASNNLIATTDWSVAKYRTNGAASTAMATPVINATNATYTANNNSLSNDAFRVRLGENTLLQATRIVIENYRYSGSGTGGDGLWFFLSAICRPDTDGDGIPNYKDNDSDADGCPDALEGGASFLYSDLDVNGRLNTSVDAQGVPLITGVPQTVGTSANTSLFDAQSACAFPETYAISINQSGMPAALNLSANPLQGSDEADQPVQGSWVSKKVIITNLPTNGFELIYNGSTVTQNQVILSYVAAQLSIQPGATTPNGTTSTTFHYSTIDIANQQDQTPASYTITWAQALPLHLVDFSAHYNNQCQLEFKWTSEDEINFSGYAIEKSNDGKSFNTIISIAGKGGSKNEYTYTSSASFNETYFRLRMQDIDGTVTYSQTIRVKNNCNTQKTIQIFPVPADNIVTVTGIENDNRVMLYNATGSMVISEMNQSGSSKTINVQSLPSGIYTMRIISKNGDCKSIRLIKR